MVVEDDAMGGRSQDHGLVRERLQKTLDAVLAETGVPGAQVAVLTPDGLSTASAGVTNLRTGFPVDDDTLFQICSISKVFTASTVMRLVDDGTLELERPVVSYLPDLRLGTPALTRGVTVRHLLDHSSGIDGDLIVNTGRGDDALARYVELMGDLQPQHPLGGAISYCNAGFSLLAHLVATVRGTTWDRALRELLLDPLGLDTVGLLPEEAILHSATVGHQVVDGRHEIDPTWSVFRSANGAANVHASARQVLRFAQLHLAGGEGLLRQETVALMQQPSGRMPDQWGLGEAMGLGWFLNTWATTPVFGHDGGGLGHTAFLRIFPTLGTAICVTTCSEAGAAVFGAIVSELAPELAGAAPPARLEPTSALAPAGAERRVGTYLTALQDSEVALVDGRLQLTIINKGPAEVSYDLPPIVADLHHVRDDLYVTKVFGKGPWVTVGFLDFAEGSSSMFFGSRLARKAWTPSPI